MTRARRVAAASTHRLTTTCFETLTPAGQSYFAEALGEWSSPAEIVVLKVASQLCDQLQSLDISDVIASAAADVVDWHEVACLVQRGCPPERALSIAR
jgi:hypothetical protein